MPARTEKVFIQELNLTTDIHFTGDDVPLKDAIDGATTSSNFDTISEFTPGAGVTVDGVLLKDSTVKTDTIIEKSSGAGVTADGVLLKDSAVDTNVAAAGVTLSGTTLAADGTDVAISITVTPKATGTLIVGAGDVSTDIIGEKTGAAGVTIDGVLLKDSAIVMSGGAIQLPRGTASSVILAGFGSTTAEGMQLGCIDETFSFVGNTDLFKETAYLFPAGAVLLCAQANIQAAATGGSTTTKVGLGTEADPDLYGKTSALTKNLKITTTPDWAVIASPVRLRVSACATDGSAGDTALTVGSVRIRIVFLAPVDLINAV
jgi:hypothetical protein